MTFEQGEKAVSQKDSPDFAITVFIVVVVCIIGSGLYIESMFRDFRNIPPKPVKVVAAYDTQYTGVHLSLNTEGKGTIYGGIFGEKSNFDWAYDGKIIRVKNWDGPAPAYKSDAVITKLDDGSIVFVWFEKYVETQITLYSAEAEKK